MKHKLLYISILLALLVSCKKNIYNNNLKLTFSEDTLSFDTVFTDVRSATHILKVYNNNPENIIINHIFLAGGNNSDFKLNINGVPSNSIKNVFLPAHDSIYILAEVNIHNLNKGYLLRRDSIIFEYGQQRQSVQLEAIGWDVSLIKKLVIESDTIWNSNKPILIWNYVIINKNATLAITPGTQIFLHHYAGIHVLGSIRIIGLPDSTITISSDRLEEYYSDVPGQWGGIVLYPSSHDNTFSWCEIKNSIIGISADSVFDTIYIDHCKILHQSYANIFANNTNINLFSSLLADAGWYNFAAINGGNYNILCSTLANYYTWGTIRTTPSLAITNYYIENNNPIYVAPANVKLINTIIYGSLEEEIILSPAESWDNFNYFISHCLLKTKKNYQTTASLINQEPRFTDIAEYDFSLDSLSPAIDKGDASIIQDLPLLRYDLEKADRLSDGLPDIGAYEYKK